jgi:putative phosphoribosyl transferase
MTIDQVVRVAIGEVSIEAAVVVPDGASGMVVFAHGSGSSRHSPRNRYVASVLQAARLGTVLADLLTASEEQRDLRTGALRFDIPLLAGRVGGLLDWLARADTPLPGELPTGLFGASTGAAAALAAAANRPSLRWGKGRVRAIVSRGGRPDLAGDRLDAVDAPTLLIVGGDDRQVLELNRLALARLPGVKELAVVPGAGHLFEEPGALEQAATLARDWFLRYLPSPSPDV